MAVYTHNTPARYTHGGGDRVVAKANRTGRTRSATFVRHIDKLRTRTRVQGEFITRERVFDANRTLPLPLGTTYSTPTISKTNRSPKSVGK